MEKHILTRKQAQRLNRLDLAWTEVEVTLKEESEKPPEEKDTRIARDIYSRKIRIGGNLDLDD